MPNAGDREGDLAVNSPRRPGVRPQYAALIIAAILPAAPGIVPVAAAGASARVTSAAHWIASQAPLPRNAWISIPGFGAQLDAIDCPSVRYCVAAGYYTPKNGAGQEGLILTRNGGKWTAVEAPLPAGAARKPLVELTSVSCPSAKMCLIAGRYNTGNGAAAAGLLITGSGKSWKARRAPVPPNTYTGTAYSSAVTLKAAYCPNTKTCVVAGTYYAKDLYQEGLLLTYTKGVWVPEEAPIEQANLMSISCTSSTSCAAVGYVPDPDNDTFPLGVVVAGFGRKWAAGKAPLNGSPPATSQSDLESVACTSRGCTAAGNFIPAGGTTPDELLAMNGKGISWFAAEHLLRESSFAGPGQVRVACPDTSTCVFGAVYTGADVDQSVAAILSKSSTWAFGFLRPPAKADFFTQLNALVCNSARSCTAVGQYHTPGGWRPMIQQSTNDSWKGPVVPLPPNGRDTAEGDLYAVSCPAAGNCVAAGFYISDDSAYEGLLLTESP
jgi:hypothetical protein